MPHPEIIPQNFNLRLSTVTCTPQDSHTRSLRFNPRSVLKSLDNKVLAIMIAGSSVKAGWHYVLMRLSYMKNLIFLVSIINDRLLTFYSCWFSPGSLPIHGDRTGGWALWYRECSSGIRGNLLCLWYRRCPGCRPTRLDIYISLYWETLFSHYTLQKMVL